MWLIDFDAVYICLLYIHAWFMHGYRIYILYCTCLDCSYIHMIRECISLHCMHANLDTILKSAGACFNLRTAVLSGYTRRTAGRVCGGKMNRGLDKKWVPDITRWFKWLKFITYSRYHLDVKIEFNLQPVSGNLYQEKSCQEVGTLAVWVVLMNKRVKRLGYLLT